MSIDTSRKKGNILSVFFWKFAERCAAQGVTLLVTIILARLLMPSDYAVIAMVTVFTNIADCLVTGGLGTALIQKEDADTVDFSSMFYFSVFFGIVLYLILFFMAPFIAKFYRNELLCNVLRVLALKLPLSALNSVQSAYVSRTMQFNKFFWATLVGTVISAVLGIGMAYKGFGSWALVVQNLSNTTIDTLFLFIIIPWRPTLEFSYSRLKRLLNFSWKLMISEVINSIYNEMRSLVVGKVYTPDELSFYNQGEKYPKFIVNLLQATISSVIFPAMAYKQNVIEELKAVTRKAITVSLFIMVPLMMGFAAVAPSVVSIFLTDKWLACVPFLQIACFCQMLLPVQSTNLQAINAVGRSDLYLKMEILKKLFGVLTILLFFRVGILQLAISSIAVTIFATIVNTTPNKKLLGYTRKEQLMDIIPNILVGAVMFGSVYWINYTSWGNWIKLLVQVVLGAAVYCLLSFVFKLSGFRYSLEYCKGFVKKIKGGK